MTSDPLNPTVEEYDDFKDIPDTQTFLNWGRDLFILDTGVTDVTGRTQVEQDMIKRAIMHMAWYLEEDHAAREDYFSGFNIERIGSYYYSKAGLNARTKGLEVVEIPAYDYAVEYFRRHSGDTVYSDLWATTSSEHVFAVGSGEIGGYNEPWWPAQVGLAL